MNKKGYTLLEVTIALAVWLILSVAVLFVWRYTAENSARLITRQNAFENARTVMDAMLMNIQIAEEICIVTDENHLLRELQMPGLDDQGRERAYTFYFTDTRPANPQRHHRVEFSGPGNEVARYIGAVWVRLVGERIEIEIHTLCNDPLVIIGSACVRHKCVRRVQFPIISCTPCNPVS